MHVPSSTSQARMQHGKWEPPQQAAFDALKQAVTSTPVLLFPDDDSPFCVEADSFEGGWQVASSSLLLQEP
ncbi:hypothetical protein C0989_010946 [Termitomyces sp. Mn162]|nr:hypothetical protein C0989_010946 [Termitomyces sp. Mn162]